jgi:hypothetical protein
MDKKHLMTSKHAPKTIFCDIDGTLVTHPGTNNNHKELPTQTHKLELLEGTIEKLWEWDSQGHRIILTTGRKESMRNITVKQLEEVGIIYDQLIMGIGGGQRYLINDLKPGRDYDTAFGINLIRDTGIKDVEL